MQQPTQINATSCATTTQQLPLKPASLLELARNKLCTKRATIANETVLQATSIHGVDVARTELTRLVRLCAEVNGFTQEEHDEALAGALSDLDSAMICFRSIEDKIPSYASLLSIKTYCELATPFSETKQSS